MEKKQFFTELRDALEIKSVETIDETTFLKGLSEYESMMLLGIIVFVDEHFNKTLTADQLRNINSVGSLMELIGLENFS